MTSVADESQQLDATEPDPHISRVPYLAGLDGLRAIAVLTVIIYHANSDWLAGGYLGVEMFFVISGYLVTLLIISEQERTYRVSLRQFWLRRARRLLPALVILLIGVTIWTVLFHPDAVGALRGDVIAGVFYVSNWYQLWVGLDYTAAGDFAPLRHLWSLAVEEQFYLVWPLVMFLLLSRRNTRTIALTSRWLVMVAVGIAAVAALLYHPDPIGEPEQTPEAYFSVFGTPISKLNLSYSGSLFRASGVLLGAALAMIWRPYALQRSPLRRVGWSLDLLAVAALGGFMWMTVRVPILSDDGSANAVLFRGGMILASLFTVFLIAAISHPAARANSVLNRKLLRWVGTRSYGLYLYHWPVFQAIRGVAGNKLTIGEFVLAMGVTVVLTEASYRLVEMPVRRRRFMSNLRRILKGPPLVRHLAFGGVAATVSLSVFAGAALAVADVKVNEITQSFADTADDVVNLRVLADENAAPRPSLGRPTTTVATPSSIVPSSIVPSSIVPSSIVPSSTVVPQPSPPPEKVPRSRGVVTDLEGIVPLGIDPVISPGAYPILAFGDSVMRGAAENLSARGVVVDAVVSRQFSAYLPDLFSIRNAGLVGSVVIVHLGTNGSFRSTAADQMMAILADVPVVVFVTGRADRGWIDGNNATIRSLPERYPNVTVLDWEIIGSGCGDCFYADRIHLNDTGQQFYTDLLGRLIGF